MSLWTEQDSPAELLRVASLLEQAIVNERKNTAAIQEFQRAIALQPDLTTAHYHLALAYARTGEKSRAELKEQPAAG